MCIHMSLEGVESLPRGVRHREGQGQLQGARVDKAIHIYIYIHTYVYIYIYIYMHMYIYIYIYR